MSPGFENYDSRPLPLTGAEEEDQGRRALRMTLAIPCYNEEAIIEATYRRLKKTCEAQEIDYEIIFGNDGSSDRTEELLNKIAATDGRVRLTSHYPNRGAGYTYREMYQAAQGDVILQMDADLAMPAEIAVPALLSALEQSDVAVGSRYVGVKADYPLKRRIFSRGYTMLTHLLFKFEIMDTQTGCLGFYRRLLEDINLESDGFEMLLELLVQTSRKGYQVTEIGLPWFHDTTSGETRVLSESIKMLAGTLRVKKRLG